MAPAIFMNQLKTLAYGQFSIYDLSVVPMFILMGNIATKAGLSRDLFRAANAWIGWMRGGTAMAAIAACAGFGAVCGSSLATASTMGQVALPELRRYGYSGSLATGTLAAGGVLGILIPPSVVLIIYAIIVEANIVTMFAAALIPGIIAVILFLATIGIYVLVRPEGWTLPMARPERAEFIWATLGVIPVLNVFGLVIGGIYAGWFNPTPAAAIGVFLVWVYGMLRGQVGPRALGEALLDTAKTGRHDLSDPAGRRDAENLHVARRRAPGRGRMDGQFRPCADDHSDPAAGRPDPFGLPDGFAVHDPAGHPVLLASPGRDQRRRPTSTQKARASG